MKATTILANALPLLAGLARAYSQADVNLLLAIAPGSSSCSNATYADECATAENIAGPLIAAYEKHNITSAGEQASILAWMAFETGDFKYNKKHFPPPGTPGQGTRCIMSPSFVAEYGATIGIKNGTSANETLTQVLNYGGEWEACAWYYATKCTDAVKEQVRAGTQAGHLSFLLDCVNTELDPEGKRLAYWHRAAAAFALVAPS